MLKSAFTLALAIVCFIAGSPAYGFWDPPYVTPSNPIAGQEVSVAVRAGICDAILEQEGYPQITRSGNELRILFFGVQIRNSDFCNLPIGTLVTPVASLPMGDYTLAVDVLYDNYPFGFDTLHLGVVPFTVTGSQQSVEPVPSIGLFAEFLLAVLLGAVALGLLAYPASRRPTLLCVFVYALHCQDAIADGGVIEFLVSNKPGAPTPDQIVAYYSTPLAQRSGPPPLASLDSISPLATTFLIPVRATGDFATWLQDNPNSARRLLEDKMLTVAGPGVSISAALATLRADPYILEADETIARKMTSATLTQFEIIGGTQLVDEGDQYGWFDLNIDEAWKLASGYALIGVPDTGLQVSHPALRQFSSATSSTYEGGNFIQALSLDVSLTGPLLSNVDSPNVDEAKPISLPANSACNPTNSTANVAPELAGHGTHVSGLISANGAAGLGVVGTCKNCGVAMWKTNYSACVTSVHKVYLTPNDNALDRATAQLTDLGVQVLNLSSGVGISGVNRSFCRANHLLAVCLGMAYAQDSRDATIVASSGNDRSFLNLPALDPRVISAGGVNQNLALWDESPGTNTSCPVIAGVDPGKECGSNYSKLNTSGTYNDHQELVAAAKSVLSTVYTGKNWTDYNSCGDSYPGPNNNGVGVCTGTSMSAPELSGLVGVLRSINPLVLTGVPEPGANDPQGIRSVLVQSASRAQSSPPLGWSSTLGYGIPDGAKAAQRMLGKVEGFVVKNRVTPLFRLRDSVTNDYAETTSPQLALSLMINQVHNYTFPASGAGSSLPIPSGYRFPYDYNDPNNSADEFDTHQPDQPTAGIYILTTEFKPRTNWPDLIPLYLMRKAYLAPNAGLDYMLVAQSEIPSVRGTGGYDLLARQGYIYKPCAFAGCVPPGAIKLVRGWNSARKDCAVFLETETQYITDGYLTTANCPGTSTSVLGYAYPGGNSDTDELPDAFENVVGTNPLMWDSDGDNLSDSEEMPLDGVQPATRDPCSGVLGEKNCPADVIFTYGFQQYN